MSMGNASAFAVCPMSDEEFRGKPAKVSAEAKIEVPVRKYSSGWPSKK